MSKFSAKVSTCSTRLVVEYVNLLPLFRHAWNVMYRATFFKPFVFFLYLLILLKQVIFFLKVYPLRQVKDKNWPKRNQPGVLRKQQFRSTKLI